jgi:ABC-type transporter Mla subunit MlaD
MTVSSNRGEAAPEQLNVADVLKRASMQLESMVDELDELVHQLEQADGRADAAAADVAQAREVAQQLVPAVMYHLVRCGEAATGYLEGPEGD